MKILFLGETYRADAITWIQGLKEFGKFEIITWELKNAGKGIKRVSRYFEFLWAPFSVRKYAKINKPDMVIAERTTTYGFLAACSGVKPIAIAQQGITDTWPENSISFCWKRVIEKYAFQKADVIHAWGEVMAETMKKKKVDKRKILILPKGIKVREFNFSLEEKKMDTIKAIVTRSITPVYGHDTILKAFSIVKQNRVPFELTIIGDGILLEKMKNLARELSINSYVTFTGRIPYSQLPLYLKESNIYISMPVTEGVSASLFEAMGCGCFPIVTDLPGNRAWIADGINGNLVNFGDEFSLAKKIIEVWTNKHILKQIILKNRKFVVEHANYDINMQIISDKYIDLINQNLK